MKYLPVIVMCIATMTLGYAIGMLAESIKIAALSGWWCGLIYAWFLWRESKGNSDE